MFILMMFLATAFGQEPDDTIVVEETRGNYQSVHIYVDISEIHAPDGTKGTSAPLNVLLGYYAQKEDSVKRRLQYWSNPILWRGDVSIYDWTNVRYMPNFNNCDYSDAIACGVKNSHWTLRTIVTVGDKYSTIIMKMYNEKGQQIAEGLKTTWGTIRWKPRWKLTKIKEQGPFGGGTKEIFEMWPPEMEELPPLIKPFHISQAVYGAFEVDQKACTTRRCHRIRERNK